MNRPRPTVDIRLRTRVSDAELEEKVGKVLTDADYNLLPTSDCVVRKPDGKILLIYRRAIIPEELREQAWPILDEFKHSLTSNRGLASGTPRLPSASGKRSYAMNVPSSIIGSFEPTGPKQFCRVTAWTGRETEKFETLQPLLRFIGDRMKIDARERWAAQMEKVAETHPDWVIPGTPFTTVTINHTYPTGVHTDKGDLDAGISTLAVFREGEFSGGTLVFPEYRIGVSMQDRDLLLMDAHSFHGNTQFDPPVRRLMSGRLEEDPGFSRISVVAYFRTQMPSCGSAVDEASRRQILNEQRAAVAIGE